MAREISDKIGAEVIISGDPCYGACDIDLDLGKEVDLVIHLGHAELGEGPDKFIYFEASMPGDLQRRRREFHPFAQRQKDWNCHHRSART